MMEDTADQGGCSSSFHRCKPPPIRELAKQSQFSERELRLLYRGFKQHCPSGLVREEHLCSIFAHLFPFGNPAPFARVMFNWLDVDKRGELPFHQYVMWLSQLARGGLQVKIAWIFRLYDANQTGELGHEEIHQFLLAIYELLGAGSCCRRSRETAPPGPLEHAVAVFRRMDARGRGAVDLDDFRRYCTESGAIVRGLEEALDGRLL